MNKKGFTLVEVLAVIVVLGLLVTIVFPVVTGTIKDSENKAYNNQLKIIIDAAKMYALDMESSNTSVIPDIGSDEPTYISIDTLVEKGYLDEEQLADNDMWEGNWGRYALISPLDDKRCTQVKVTYESNQYTYQVFTDSVSCTPIN